MATNTERLAAAKQALSAIGVTDDEEAEGFVAMFKAVSAFEIKNDAAMITLSPEPGNIHSRRRG
jgi:hypothetical protein